MKRLILIGSLAMTIGLLVGTAPAFAATVAQEPAPTVIASDPTPAITQVLADRINGITVISPEGGLIVAQSSGHVTRAVRARAGQPAVLVNLDPGARYTITLDGARIGFASPVGQVGPATGLRVETTGNAGEVQMSWSHTPNKGEGNAVQYTATATVVNGTTPIAKSITSDTHTTLTGLVMNQRYVFAVTPANSAGTGRPSSATMQQTLAEFTGVLVEQPAAQPAPALPAAPPVVPAASPAPPAGPSTRTIWVCPDGFTDAGSLCQKTQPYTFHQVTTTSPYTYHQQFTQTGSHVNFSASPNGGTYYPQDAWNSNDGSPAGYYSVIPDGYYTAVKDAPPTGFTDNGSTFVKTEQVKDAGPSGYTDNGSAWVMLAAKLAQQVPA